MTIVMWLYCIGTDFNKMFLIKSYFSSWIRKDELLMTKYKFMVQMCRIVHRTWITKNKLEMKGRCFKKTKDSIIANSLSPFALQILEQIKKHKTQFMICKSQFCIQFWQENCVILHKFVIFYKNLPKSTYHESQIAKMYPA